MTENTKRSRDKGEPRQYRMQMQKDAGDLCGWAQQGMGLPGAPSLNKVLASKHNRISQNDASDPIDCNRSRG